MGGKQVYQDHSRFKLPKGFRGRNAVYVQLWWIVQSSFFKCSPQVLYPWRRFLLRLFGAKIGRNVLIRPTVKITYPWKVEIGEYAQIGDGVELYSLGEIYIGRHAVVSQGSYVCTGSHDHTQIDFPIFAKKIIIESEVWISAQCFISPGVTVGRGAFCLPRSLVTKDIPEGKVVAGHPARVIGDRLPNGNQ
ncbi:WcaF family extracellular polysaccharide biosynthesis acetyltransferase [Zhongshania marina]|uniref:Colanic acid biosynthesis acetyltransferase WcaF n=1 Tax=Zhongshania marina TaxID=2304603 RepID=A0ABX9W7E9_9GAMM|nr:colanic acid biosynthesis acetyltransferase WcaF [Zhongshania marina]